ncbi:glycosyltransferase family A protein [Streptosporangium sp. NPDC048047]|uniref:glycosyltransferase family 2 protein n=1 Tax=Streptosporangium sp. NPDC048047 TaxID=3155748 RepID=UPI003432B789
MSGPSGPAAFVIPFWSDGRPHRLGYLRQALDSVRAQTDPDVFAVVVDDCSDSHEDRAELLRWERDDARLRVVLAPDNRGPGRCRNMGVRVAADAGADFVCFLDADDLTHPDRVRTVRDALAADAEADLVYSGFVVIDGDGDEVGRDRLISSVKIIMDDIEKRPLEGHDCWVSVAVERDNLTIPSALSARTALALEIPFPEHCRFFEDTHTWLRYSASGAKIAFAPAIPSRYRIPDEKEGSESRRRAGGIEAFNRMRVEVTEPGLAEAVDLAVRRGVIDPAEGLAIRTRYLLNVAGILLSEGTGGVARDLVDQARALSFADYLRYRDAYPVVAALDPLPPEQP